jgi:hypothetical protein
MPVAEKLRVRNVFRVREQPLDNPVVGVRTKAGDRAEVMNVREQSIDVSVIVAIHTLGKCPNAQTFNVELVESAELAQINHTVWLNKNVFYIVSISLSFFIFLIVIAIHDEDSIWWYIQYFRDDVHNLMLNVKIENFAIQQFVKHVLFYNTTVNSF